MPLRRITYNLCVVLLLCSVFLLAQTTPPSRTELEQKKKTLQTEITKLQKQLDATAKDKNATKAQVDLLKKQIGAREELISTYNNQISKLGKAIEGNQKVQSELESDLNILKKSYAHLVRFNYTHTHDATVPTYLLRKDDMQAAVFQQMYAHRLHAYETTQIKLIADRTHVLNSVLSSLKEQQNEKQQYLLEQQQQKQQLTAVKQLHDKKYEQLTATETSIRTKLLAKKADAAKLNKQIEAIIRKEIEAAREKARAEALAHEKTSSSTAAKTTTTTTVSSPALTADMMKLADNFEANRGRLPWPAKGTIVETFGTHQHADLTDVVTNNNGVDIALNEGANVQSVFEGVVVAVFANAGYQNAVLVQHGDYYTVYANLASVSVKKGDKIKLHQTLGTIYTQPDTHKSILHFEIWKGTSKLNPQNWLAG